jgi:non-ribosomal peptide synthase protein (TIGR01720 family)
LEKGESPTLPVKTVTYQAWTKQLKNHSSQIPKKVKRCWEDFLLNKSMRLPVDNSDGINNFSSKDRVRLTLDEENTSLLLKQVVKQLDASINSILLAPHAKAFDDIFECSSLLIAMESHGRDGLDELDVSNTMGWFTNIYPVFLKASKDGFLAGQVQIIGTMLQSIPNKGFDYLLMDGSKDKERPLPEISFNYLGKFGGEALPHAIFDMAYESYGFPVDSQNMRSHLFNIVIAVVDNRLSVDWSFSSNFYRKETVKRLADCYLSQIKLLMN